MLPQIQRYGARLLALLGLVLATSSGHAQVTYSKSFPASTTVDTFSGSTAPTTPGSPKFNRPFASGNTSTPPTSLSGIGTSVSYAARTFTVPTTGAYTITVTGTTTYGVAAYLYSAPFSATAPLTNVLAGDNPGSTNSVVTLTQTLTASTPYVLVVTSYDNGVVGSFTGSVKPTPVLGSPVFTASNDTTPTGGSPVFNRPFANGNTSTPPTSLSGIGTSVYYNVSPFTVTTSGSYTITATAATAWGIAAYLYQTAFDPANPLANILAGDNPSGTTSVITLTQTLTAGTQYYLVTSSYTNGVTGSFTTDVSSAPVLGSTVFTASGTTAPASGSPVFNRPLANGNSAPTSLSGVGTSVYYQAQTFTVTTSGTYRFLSTCVSPTAWDNYVFLYKDSFTPATPLVNCLIGNDGTTASSAGFDYALTAGTTYYFVTAAYGNGVTGTFTNTISPVTAPIYDSWSGTTVGGPLFHRPTSLTAASTSNYEYDAHTWIATVTGTVTFKATCVSPAAWDTWAVLYTTFNPASPVPTLAYNDEFAGSAFATASGFTYNVTSGTSYTFVTTGYYAVTSSSTHDGTYAGTITGAATVGSPVVSYNNGLSAGAGATYNRVDANGNNVPTALSATATATYYQAKTFTVPTTGLYSVLSTANTPANWDNYTTLYTGTFSATAPLTGVKIANDNQTTVGKSGFNLTLNSGTTYTLVTSGATNSSFGSYDVAVAPITGGGSVASSSGSLSAGTGTTFNRPIANGNSAPTALSGTNTYYKADTFTVPTTGSYQIASTSVAPTNWDNYAVLYNGTFTPATPLANIVAANDTLTTVGTAGFASITLTAGTTYTLVTTGYAAANFGTYNVAVAPITSGPEVLNYTDATVLGSGGPTFNRPFASGNTSTPPTALSGIGTSVFYLAHPFTVPTTGLYTITATGATAYGIAAYLYTAPFSATAPLTNVLAGDNPGSTNSVVILTQNLTAGTQYVIVATAYDNNVGGAFTTKVTSGANTIPDGSLAGLSLTNTVTDTFSISALNGVTILGLKHPYAGDLVATLTHGTVSIELFDRVGAIASGDFGSANVFNGDYAFATGGSDLEAAGASSVTPIPDFTTGGITYAPDLNGSAGESSTLTGDFTAFNGMPVTGDWTLKITDYATLAIGTYDGFSFTVTPDAASVSGTLTLDSIAATAVPQAITFTFRPTAGGADIVKTALVGPNGTYTITGLPKAAYTLHIKGWKYLAVNVPVDTTGGNLTGVNVTLTGGDANNDNTIDIGDFGILVNTYGSSYDVNVLTLPDPNVESDFNGDGTIDIGDFGILVNSYGSAGAP